MYDFLRLLTLIMSVGISKVDVQDFQTIDDTPVRLLFMIAASYNQHAYYLQTLSYFSTKLKNKDLREALLETENLLDAYNLLVQ